MIAKYEIPPMNAGAPDRLAWLTEQLREGEAYIRATTPTDDIKLAMKMISGKYEEKLPRRLSNLRVNYVRRQVREVVATLSNLRPMWGYSNDNREYDAQTSILNKLLQGWWMSSFADRRIKEALQYAAVQGVGYISPIWDKDFWTAGRGDVALHVYGLYDVIPIQMGPDSDLQNAYAVILKIEVPINRARNLYPAFADKITPDRIAPSWYSQALGKVRRFLSPILEYSQREESASGQPPTVDICYAYVLDNSINQSGQTVPMGDPGTSWYYEVPSFGSDLSTGVHDLLGRPLTRKAGYEDSRLYPMRRLITFTSSCVIADGPSPWWHAKVPVVPFYLDDWPWEPFGAPVARDGLSVQATNISLLRAIVDSANVRLDPPAGYNRDTISNTAARKVSLRVPGQRIPIDTTVPEHFKPLVDPRQYDVPPWILELIPQLWAFSDKLLGLNDVQALARSRAQMPAADTIDKVLELAGPVATDQSRSMEPGLAQIGEMFKSLVFQFYTDARRIKLLGPDGVTPEDFDYDPGTLIPAGMGDSSNRITKAKLHQNRFLFHVTPASLHQITQTSRRLMYLQLSRVGFPIDPWTLAEIFDVPNFGRPPEGANTVIERWVAWNELQMELAAKAQQMQQMQSVAAALRSSAAPGLGPPHPEGRPPTAQTVPHIETRDGGSRTTIAESR